MMCGVLAYDEYDGFCSDSNAASYLPADACARTSCVCVCGLDAYIFFLYLIFFERNINMMNDTNDMNDEHNELNPLNQR